MKDKLKQVLAADMNIRRFKDESDCDFNQRLIYSAGAAWAKTLVYGQSYTDVKAGYDFANTDIMYIQSHLGKVLEAYLKSFEVNYKWLEQELSVDAQARELASQIIKDILYTFNLAEINSRRIIPLKVQFYKYNRKFLVRGEWFMDKTVYSVGVAQWILNSNIDQYVEDKRIVDVDGRNYYRVIEEQFKWYEAELNSNYMMFVVGMKGGYSKCWKPVEIADIPFAVVMLRLADEFNGGYILARKRNGIVEISDLDPWYIEEKEIYRILYALNYKNGTPAEFKVKRHMDFYELQFASALPKYEDRIVNCCSWPNGVYNSKYARIVPNYLWYTVESILTFLGITIKYQ